MSGTEVSVENLRAWIQSLGIAAIGSALLIIALRPALPAFASDEKVECRLLDSSKLGWGKSAADIVLDAEDFLNSRGAREHIAVLPYGRTGTSGGETTSIMCLW